MTKSKLLYNEKIYRAINYINEHLDENLDVEKISEVACLSKFHFHRLFKAQLGINIAKYVLLKRLRRASFQLSINHEIAITEIALSAGFENSESFSRAFKSAFQQSPSEFRKAPFDKHWLKQMSQIPSKGENTMVVTIENFPETTVAALEHHGPVEEKMNTLLKFIHWRKANDYPPNKYATYNIFYGETELESSDAFRFDVCCEIDSEVEENLEGIKTKIIPAGRCAVLRHLGSSDNLEDSMSYMYKEWLPASGEELRDFPVFVHRVKLESQGSESDAITDIYLPLQ